MILSVSVGCSNKVLDSSKGGSDVGSMDVGTDYQEFVNHFIKVGVDDIYELQKDNKKFFLYTGRESCPYCKLFVSKLAEASINIEIYYLDSIDSYDNSTQELKDFRDKFLIETVPSLIYFHGDEVVKRLEILLELDSNDIADFLNIFNDYK